MNKQWQEVKISMTMDDVGSMQSVMDFDDEPWVM